MTILIVKNSTFNSTKINLVLVMAAYMGAIEIGMYIFMNKSYKKAWIILLIGFLLFAGVFSWIIMKQKSIDQKQFMLQMIEHHEMAIVMATEQRKKQNDPRLIKIIDDIIVSQNGEIEEMREILQTLP